MPRKMIWLLIFQRFSLFLFVFYFLENFFSLSSEFIAHCNMETFTFISQLESFAAKNFGIQFKALLIVTATRFSSKERWSHNFTMNLFQVSNFLLTCKSRIISCRSVPTRVPHVCVMSGERKIIGRRAVALNARTVVERTHCVWISHIIRIVTP